MTWLQEQAAALFGVQLSDAQLEQFAAYERALLDWNQRMNLTGITEPQAVRTRHFLDSLSLVTVMGFDAGDTLVDVGTGAGFPGLPLAIAFPDLQVTLMEATAKKLTFIDHIIGTLGLTNARTLHSRAEDAGQHADHRARYDVAVARAVALLPALLEYLLPLVKQGGFAIAMKGASAHREADEARRALYVLGGELQGIADVQLPDVEHTHHLITVQKVQKTPKAYPRKAGTPTRSPIGMPSKPA